jgi:Ca2+-binding RTX toxin-like protein
MGANNRHPKATGRRRTLGILAGALALIVVQLGPAPAGANPGTLLIYGPSMDSTPPNELTVAAARGHAVTVASESQWAAMTTAQFSAFDALVIGDAGCVEGDTSPLDTARDNRTIWSSAVTGNITLNTFDSFDHDSQNEADDLAANSMNFAASGAGTGLSFSLGCYFGGGGEQALTLMDQFGAFTVDGDSGNTITILQPAHPVMAGLTNAGLSNWSSSVHAHFVASPATFQALAQDSGVSPGRTVVLARTAPPPAPPTCKGKPATVFGGPSNDVLTGTPNRDVIMGLAGRDRVQAGGGKDLVCGGVGNDILKGGSGKDTLLGQGGRDLLAGGSGAGDVCKGGPGLDSAKGSCEAGRA